MQKYLLIIITGLLILQTNVGLAQDKITQELNAANITFEEGKIIEALNQLKKIEAIENLSKDQKEKLYRQMTICYIFMDKDNVFLSEDEAKEGGIDSLSSNLKMAENSYLNLLNVNNIYMVDSMDIIDYVRFTKKFSSKPILVINPKVGMNTSLVDVLEYYGNSSLGIDDTSYYNLKSATPYGFTFNNLSFGLDVDWNCYKNFTVSLGGGFTQRSFAYGEDMWFGIDNSSMNTNDDNGLFTLSFIEKQNWVDASVKVKYDIGKNPKILPYVYGGATYHRLVGASINDVQRTYTENLDIKDNVVLDARFKNNYSFIGGAGLKWRTFGKHYLTVNVEYGRMMGAINDIDRRYTSEAANRLNYDFGYVDNSIRMNNLSFMIGFAYAFYNPKMIKTLNEK